MQKREMPGEGKRNAEVQTCSVKALLESVREQAEKGVCSGGRRGKPPPPRPHLRPPCQPEAAIARSEAERTESCRDSGGGASTAGQHPRAGTRCRAASVRLGATRGLLWQEEELLAQHAGVTIHRESQTHVSLTTLQPLSLIFFNK